ncbi:hypothetical protein, conserved [Trypanosoma brucei brucei TREU927]|uniref:Methyltransferase small domain-containing protein n=1 Tax=Trypanosoma brucei brucei (strain 927/4 GUTat10.1) TaxID=185431 RepID=Q381Q6_TRYB2|nr:hypothetical protein, conserved [Trypanosoma brucei brucei TREU927]EAN80475.1 hypothetical protein, conserved [Trypanosoma brucei brucei TREU927]
MTQQWFPLMAVTPDYLHCITEERFRTNVYEPEADTFLLLEALDKDAHLLRALQPRRCVEIGCGSGTVISHLMLLLLGATEGGNLGSGSAEKSTAEFHAVDVNPVALEATSITWHNTQKRIIGGDTILPLHLHRGDLFSPFEHEASDITEYTKEEKEEFTFDVILFNPPYVPTTMEELQSAEAGKDLITAAWCGGPRGRVVVDRFISKLPSFLSSRGVCYIVAIRENDVEELMEVIRGTFPNDRCYPVNVTVTAERYTGEHLRVIRVSHDQQSAK